MAEQLRDHLRFTWAALAHDGGEYGIGGAISGGNLWTVILAAGIGTLAALGILH